MKKLIFLFLFVLIGCVSNKPITKSDIIAETSISDINNSIIDGFYNNDTIGISNKIYLLKLD